MSDFAKTIPVVIAHEAYHKPDGSWLYWVDDPDDSGGETAWGISMLMIKAEGITPQEIGLASFTPGCLKNLTMDKAEYLYKKFFWDRYSYGKINDWVCSTKVCDCGVNCGPGHAGAMAQRAANMPAALIDGILGDKSFALINSIDPKKYVPAMAAEMKKYYTNLVAAKPSLSKFLNNWLQRAEWGVNLV